MKLLIIIIEYLCIMESRCLALDSSEEVDTYTSIFNVKVLGENI